LTPRSVALALVLFPLTSAAVAQDTAAVSPPVQDWSTTIETVVVTAQKPGPALWHIAANGSDVWILGTVSPLPEGLAWNTDELAKIIDGANIVYMPPSLTAGLFEVSWFLLTGLGSLKQPDGQTLEASLPAHLRARFVATRIKLGKDADTYADYLPPLAAQNVENDFREHAQLDSRTVEEQISKIARAKHVKTQALATYDLMPIIHEVPNLSAQQQQECLVDALDDIDVQSVHANDAARAWAVGNLAGVKAHYSEIKLYECFRHTKSFAADWEHVIDDGLVAVQSALAKPGKSLIVIGIGPLLRKNGLLDRLQERGIAVEAPPG
jgi:uncharacterized protein YbaP (TraB family)